MVRAKLTGTWEGGGIGGKNIQTKNSLRGGTCLPIAPWEIGLNSISNNHGVRGGNGRRSNSIALENPKYQM